MLALAAKSRDLIRHVIRAPDVYLVPRSDGRILVGATLEEAGYDKRIDADTIQHLRHAAVSLVPALASTHAFSRHGQACDRVLPTICPSSERPRLRVISWQRVTIGMGFCSRRLRHTV